MALESARHWPWPFAVALLLAFLAGWIGGRGSPAARSEATFASEQRGHLQRLDRNGMAGRVVFLGSSSIQGMDITGVTPIGLNLGLGGDTLDGLQQRMAGYQTVPSAAAIVVNIGLNDLLQTCRLPTSALERLMTRWPTAVPLVMVGVQGLAPEQRRNRCEGRMDELVHAFNRALDAACQGRKPCRFVMSPVPADVDAPRAQTLLEPDGIHLSIQGYAALKAAIRSALLAIGGPELVGS